MNPRACVIITPVRNEAKFLPLTIDSMVAQTVRPREWVIVDDGSTDDTAEIVSAAAEQHAWLTLVRRPDRGFRKAGGGVIEAFYDGFKIQKSRDWECVSKLDGDLSFGKDFLEKCLGRFASDPKLGIGGGSICRKAGTELVVEAPGDPAFHVRGATKFYRRECWDGIGGLLYAPGWDTVDEYKANMLGWTTYTFPELKLHHHRFAGGAEGAWKNWVKNGRANYVAGYHPLFMLVKCLRRMGSRPFATAGFGLLTGFLSGYVRRVPQVPDRDLIRYLRSQQLRRLFFQQSLWNIKAPVPAES